MKLQDQVCTLEQAKRLKELGVVQGKSAFAFIKNKCHDEIKFRLRMVLMEGVSYEGYEDWEGGCLQGYSAFTVAELGEMLIYFELPLYWKLWGEWCYKEKDQPRGYPTEAQARAAKLIYLIESNLTTTEAINKAV